MAVMSVLEWISEHRHELATPLYLYDTTALDRAADRLRALFPRPVSLFYSLKANPQPGIVRRFAERGIQPEVASAGERWMCGQAGVEPREILIGGVSKSVADFEEICDSGCRAVVVESLPEWARLRAVADPRNRPGLLLRIAPGVSSGGGLDMAGESQFGMSVEQALGVAREAAGAGFDCRGLHFYFGSQRLKPEPIVEMIRIVTRTLRSFRDAGLPAKTVDVGLGCGVPYAERDPELDGARLAADLAPHFGDPAWEQLEIWTEAGRALVAGSGYFVTRVVDRKELYDRRFAFLDGGLNVHNPGIGLGRMFRSNPGFLFVSEAERAENPIQLVGNLCTSADCLGRDVEAPDLRPGDLVVIPNSGAYCQTTGFWGFISQPLFSEGLLDADFKYTPLVPQHELFLRSQQRIPTS